VDSVTVYGNVRVPLSSVLAMFEVFPGDTVSFREIQLGAKVLMASGEFADVQVLARDTQGDRAVLVLEVEERPQVRRVVINGLEHANASNIQDSVNLDVFEPYEPQEVRDAKVLIRSELTEKGIPFARIEERIEEVEGAVNVVDVIIDVDEGNRVTIADVVVQGNESVSRDDILGAMTTRQEGFLWFKAGGYDRDDLEADLATAIPDVYRARGFLDFRVVHDTLLVDPATGKAQVVLTVEEGLQYRLGNVTIEGNEEFGDSVLTRFFAFERRGLLSGLLGRDSEEETMGPPFDAVAFDKGADDVRELYANQGFLYADVLPLVVKNPVLPGQPPTVDVSWEIEEGLPAYIRQVKVTGNDYTYDYVVRDHLLLLPGDRYSQEFVLQSYRSIGALGFFETPLPPPDIDPDPVTGDVDVTFRVEEKQTGSINFGTSMGGGYGLSGFIGYEQPNLFGQAKAGSMRWDFGRYMNNMEVSFSDPALFKSMVSGSVNLFNTRDRFFQFATGRRKRLGTSLNVGFPVPGATRTRVFTGYSVAHTKYELFNDVDDTSLFGLPPGTQSTLLLGLVRSTVNHPVFPTAGSRQSWNTELNGGPLGGDGNFTKQTFEGVWWVPVSELGEGGGGGPQMALGLTLKGGAIFGDVSAFPFDRFWMGGVQFGQQLRGYDETAITPLGYFPREAAGVRDVDRLADSFLAVSAEYALRISGMASVSLFFDAGNVWARPQDIDPTRLFRGAGVGVLLVTPFGPIGLDYGYGFDKAEPGWQFHFKMGPGM
jgi:outer membrane protein insertion porin family